MCRIASWKLTLLVLDETLEDAERAQRFFELFMTSHKQIYAFILMMVHNRNDADDVMQETAVLLWTKFDKFVPGGRFAAWGIGVARNCVMKFRDKHKKGRLQFGEPIYDLMDSRASNFENPDNGYIDALEGCTGKLKECDRKIVSMRYKNGISVKEIASILGRSVNGLYKSMARIHTVLEMCIKRNISNNES